MWLSPAMAAGGLGWMANKTVARGARVGEGVVLGVGVIEGVGVSAGVAVSMAVAVAVTVGVSLAVALAFGVPVGGSAVAVGAVAVRVSRSATCDATGSLVGVAPWQ